MDDRDADERQRLQAALLQQRFIIADIEAQQAMARKRILELELKAHKVKGKVRRICARATGTAAVSTFTAAADAALSAEAAAPASAVVTPAKATRPSAAKDNLLASTSKARRVLPAASLEVSAVSEQAWEEREHSGLEIAATVEPALEPATERSGRGTSTRRVSKPAKH